MKHALLALAFLLATPHRLPAPIREISESPTPAPEQSAKPKAKHSKPKSKNESEESKSEAKSTPRPSGKAKNLGGPGPQYPPEAVPLHLSGVGIYLLHFDQSTGLVTEVTVVQSAGSPILDQAAITGFRQWHEDPHCAKEVTMTMTFPAPRLKQ